MYSHARVRYFADSARLAITLDYSLPVTVAFLSHIMLPFILYLGTARMITIQQTVDAR